VFPSPVNKTPTAVSNIEISRKNLEKDGQLQSSPLPQCAPRPLRVSRARLRVLAAANFKSRSRLTRNLNARSG